MANPNFLAGVFAKENSLFLEASETHPFLTGCANGTVTSDQFNIWLIQDYMYVNSFKPFLESMMAAAPAEDMEILNAGHVALEHELIWFETKAKDRDLELKATPLPTTVAYKYFMESMVGHTYSYQLAALYMIERVYQKAWSVVLERGGKYGLYSQFAQNWGNIEFKGYVDQLEVIAEREMSTSDEKAEVAALYEMIMKLEIKFWDMAFEA